MPNVCEDSSPAFEGWGTNVSLCPDEVMPETCRALQPWESPWLRFPRTLPWNMSYGSLLVIE